jgi:hypothetical protein
MAHGDGSLHQPHTADTKMSTITEISVALALASTLGACAAPAVIADISDSSVRVQGNQYTENDAYMTEASRGCELYGKTPVPLSETRTGPYGAFKQVLFACK